MKRIACALIVGLCAAGSFAQPGEVPTPQEEVLQAVRDRINASYLTEDERADLAVEHGLWNEHTLADPVRNARVALIIGAYDHPALMNPDAAPLDRAQAALMRGEPDQTLELLDLPIENAPLRRLAIRARAFSMLGDTAGAITELETLESLLAETTLDDATELAFGVRGLMHLYTLRPIDADASVVYRQLNELIARGRDTIDQLNTEIRMVEAELLYEHHNNADAREAAIEVIKRNAKHARAAALLGHITVDSFLIDDAERIADRIDSIASDEAETPPATVHGAAIRARLALRRRDPLGAELAIDPALARMPDQRDLLALEASAAAAGFRSSSTERLLLSYDQRSPERPEALLSVGRTLSEARQYEESERILRRAIERAPHWGEPRLQLGLMLVQAGDDVGAKDALGHAIALDPFNLRAQNSLKLVSELMGYESIESEHFIVKYKAGIDSILAKEMIPELERMYIRVTGNTPGGVDHEPSRKTRIELMPNHEWFAVRIGGMPSIHTMAASTGPIIAMEAPRDGLKMSVGPYDWARVLQHEFTHTVNLSRTHNRIIHWMTEANAVYNEDSPRDSRQWAMLLGAFSEGRLFDLVEINEAFIRPKRKGDRSLAYAQGAWMFEFIIEQYGPRAPLDIMDASAAGRSPTEAFTQTLGVDLDTFMDSFLAWAQEQLTAFGLLHTDGTHTSFKEIFAAKPGVRLDEHERTMAQEYARSNPTEETPHRLLARHFLASETLEERRGAIEHLEYLDAREIHSSAYANELAMLYAQSGMGERAIAKALIAVRRNPFDAKTREQAARIAIIADDLALAAHHIEVLTVLEPDREIHTQRLEAILDRLD